MVLKIGTDLVPNFGTDLVPTDNVSVSDLGTVSLPNSGTENWFLETKMVPKFGTKSVPKIGTIFGSRVSEMLLHAFQKCWYKGFGSIEPDGSHWWAGLMAAIMDCGGSFWLALRHACLRN